MVRSQIHLTEEQKRALERISAIRFVDRSLPNWGQLRA